MNVRHDATANQGRFVLLDGEQPIGELTWRRTAPGVVSANHTWITPARRGGGLGAVLFEALVAWARTERQQVIPACSFVADMFEVQPASRDVMAPSPD